MSGSMKCQNCCKEISEDDLFVSEGKTLCEDCYIDVGHRIRVCDPWGERSKKIFRESHGLTGTDGLTDLQKSIYEFIKANPRVFPGFFHVDVKHNVLPKYRLLQQFGFYPKPGREELTGAEIECCGAHSPHA